MRDHRGLAALQMTQVLGTQPILTLAGVLVITLVSKEVWALGDLVAFLLLKLSSSSG